MASTDITAYVTLKYVEPELLKCSNSNCPYSSEAHNRIDTQLRASTEDGIHLWVRLYFCNACYQRYKHWIQLVKDEETKVVTPFEEANEAHRAAFPEGV